MRKLNISLFVPPRIYTKDGEVAYAHSSSCTQFSGDWQAFLKSLKHIETEDKHAVGSFAPVVFKDDVRSAANAQTYSILVLDVDNKVDSEDKHLSLDQAKAAIDATGVYYCLYTSYSHSQQKHKYRIVVPLVDDVPKEQMLLIYHGFIRLLGLSEKINSFDRTCMCDYGRIFYLPSCPPSSTDRKFICGGHSYLDPSELDLISIINSGDGVNKAEQNGPRLDIEFMSRFTGDFRYIDIQKTEASRGKSVLSVGAGDKDGWYYIECPWCDDHSSKNQPRDTAIIHREGDYPVFHCLHDSCKKAGPNRIREYLEMFLPEELDKCFTRPYVKGQSDATMLALMDNTKYSADIITKKISDISEYSADAIKSILHNIATLDDLDHDGCLKAIQKRFPEQFSSIKNLKQVFVSILKERKRYEDTKSEIKLEMTKDSRIQQSIDRMGRLYFAASDSRLYQYNDESGWRGRKKDLVRNVLIAEGIERDILNRVQDEIPIAEDIVYYPPTLEPVFNKDGGVYLNVYRGIPTVPAEGEFSLMTDILTHLMGTDADKLDYVLDWLAQPLQLLFSKQFPRKNLTALVFHGAEGTGKNCFAEIMKHVYGPANFGILDQAALEDRFTPECLYGSLFICANEVNFNSGVGKNPTNKQKEWITETTINCRRMFAPSSDLDTFFNMVYFSNESVPVYIEEGNRRYSIFFQDEKMKQDLINRFKQQLVDGFPCAKAFLHHLLSRKISHNIAMPLHTLATDALIDRNKNSAKLFVDDIIEYGILDVAHHFVQNAFGSFKAGEHYVEKIEDGEKCIFVYHQILPKIYNEWAKANGRKSLGFDKLKEILAGHEADTFPILKKNVRFGSDGAKVNMCYGGSGFYGNSRRKFDLESEK